MDYQQVTEAEKAWLAGFLDGEGHLSITLATAAGYPKLTPVVNAVNTHKPTIERVFDILTRLGISPHLKLNERSKKNKKHKDIWTIQTNRGSYIKKLLEALLPYLFTKKEQALLILTLVNRRELGYTRLTEDDLLLEKRIKELNKNGN